MTQCYKSQAEKEDKSEKKLKEIKCCSCNRLIENLKGTIRCEGKIYCSLGCFNREICKK